MDTVSAAKHQLAIPYAQQKALAAQTAVSAPAALTSTAPSAGYVQAEATAVRTDLSNLRATVLAMHTALTAAGYLP